MIRKRNGKDIADEEFLNIILPFENVVEEYFINKIIINLDSLIVPPNKKIEHTPLLK